METDTRTELMAVPIVAVVLIVGVVLGAASIAGIWAWFLVGIAAVVLAVLLIRRFVRRHPHPVADTPPPADVPDTPGAAEDTYRVLVIADESLIDPNFPARLQSHAGGRKIEVLVIAPAIGSWLSRWTNDESVHEDARRHLDDTVTALAHAGITARGETGADDPLQAADDGVREFGGDEIVFVTKPDTSSGWVEKGVIEAATRRYPVPVTHLTLPGA